MNILSQLNSPVIYLICAVIVLFVALVCVVFAVRAYRAGKAIGMDVTKMKRTIVASATFAVLPSVGILLGVIALSGSLGTPWPWLRLSVIGALHYETQVAEAAAEAVGQIRQSRALSTMIRRFPGGSITSARVSRAKVPTWKSSAQACQRWNLRSFGEVRIYCRNSITEIRKVWPREATAWQKGPTGRRAGEKW